MLSAIREIEQRRQAGTLSDMDADLLKEYLIELQAERSMSDRGLLTEFRMIVVWSKYLSFSTMTTRDILEAKMAMDARGLKQNTMRGYLHKFLRFARWCAGRGHDIDTSRLGRIKLPRIDYQTKTAAAMLTPEEVKKIVGAARQIRDKAIFSILYEGGLRPVEMVRLKWGQVKFDEYGAVINTSEKTGMPRYIRLLSSADYLAKWQTSTPGGRGPNDPVFVTVNAPYRPITYALLQFQLKELVRRAGIEKEVSLYLFRHSRITDMVEKEIPESVIKMQHWGSLRTGMLATYAHVTGVHTDEVLLDRAGIKRSKKRREKDAMDPCQCPHCLYINPPSAQYCSSCGQPITPEAKLSFEEKERRVHSSDEFKELEERLERLEKQINK